jgi:SGNH hydrolase-like domain, acetyltransferase AlgX
MESILAIERALNIEYQHPSANLFGMSRGRRILLTALLPVLATLITLGTVEVALRLFRPTPVALEAAVRFEKDPDTAYRLLPGSVGHFHRGIPVVVNRYGLRDEEVPLAKGGALRILAIGDSFTFGTDVEAEEAFPEQLEAILGAELDRPLQVVNAGVGGWSPYQYAQYYESRGWRWDPDLIVVGFYVGNDSFTPERRPTQIPYTVVATRRVRREALKDRWLRQKIWLYEHSHLARLYLNRGKLVSNDFRRATCDDFSPGVLDLFHHELRVHLPHTRRLEGRVSNAVRQVLRLRDAGVPVLVVLIPDETQVNPRLRERLLGSNGGEHYDFDMPQGLFVSRFTEGGIGVLDLLDVLRHAQDGCLYMNDLHWTPTAHRLAAEAIAARLRADCAPWADSAAPWCSVAATAGDDSP